MTLTPRQTEVIALRCGNGLHRKEIAVRLGIKEETVREHLSIVAQRTGLSGYQVCAEWGRMQAVTATRSDAV
jgi:DNA-binding CsgD family transcriptional regulator